MCFAFSSWRDSLTSALATLGAKPNHGFFHCQHPGAKKIPARDADADRAPRPATRASHRARRVVAARSDEAFRRKRFFSAVLFPRPRRPPTPRDASAGRARAIRMRMKRGESASCDVRRTGPDFASHKPECAELRERRAPGNDVPRSSTRPCRDIRCRVRSVRPHRARRAASPGRRCAGQEKSRPRMRAACSRSASRRCAPSDAAPPGTCSGGAAAGGESRGKTVSDPRLRAVRRSRRGRAVR